LALAIAGAIGMVHDHAQIRADGPKSAAVLNARFGRRSGWKIHLAFDLLEFGRILEQSQPGV
jgi:hypothetical protein